MHSTELKQWLGGAFTVVSVVVALVLLTACGGGDPEPDKRVELPKCGAPGVCV